ncbi:SulP family inorganic anion transporter [Streptomyces sp. NPDC006670]|uniref:SulP family inorganic anion transporter n=1 Tax=Streptomyces sp. NPDC006670 TaxID=3154476 RepID=UPI0033C213BC
MSAKNVVPLLGQLRGYSAGWARADAVTGFAVAVMLVPQALAYGQLAGLSPAAGLYTAVGGMVLFALLTSTRGVSVGPSSTLAIMTFAAVSSRAGGDAGRMASLAGCLALLTGVLLLPSGRLRGLANFLSAPVMLGYAAGTGVEVVASQMGTLVGVKTSSDRPLVRVWEVLTHLDQVQLATAGVGLAALAVLVVLKRVRPAAPGSLVVCAVAVAVSAAAGLSAHGVAVAGRVVGGLPVPAWPDVAVGDVWALLPAAAGMAMIISIEAVDALRAADAGSRERASLARESLALGVASAGAGVLGGFAPTAKDPQRGARSQVFQLVGAGFVVFALVTGGPVIGLLPLTVLAAVIIVSGFGLIDVAGFLRLWRGWRGECVLAFVAAVSVVALGVLQGLLVAVLLALGQLLRRTAWPRDAVLAVPDDGGAPHEVAPDVPAVSDVLIYRVDAPLFFANVNRVHQRVLSLAGARAPSPRYVVLDAEAVFYLDSTAAEVLAQLTADLREHGSELVLARPRDRVLAALRASPFRDGATRQLRVFSSVREAYAALREPKEG